MSEHKLTEMQLKLLDMLRWFDTFCRNNKLEYYAVGGTLLGAVRHKGFIPWDDDIDLAMPRDDYIKLEKIMSGKKYGPYVLETQHSNASDYCYPYTKLYDTRTTLVEHCRKPLVRGIFLDIFPLDGAGSDPQEAKKWFKSVYRYYQFYLSRIAALRKDRSLYKNLAIILSRIIPEFIIDNIQLRINLDRKCQKYKLSESKFGGNFLGNWGEKELVPLSIIGKPVEYIFEDITIMGIENYDAYLTHIYGDWHKLPPKEKQSTHHDFLKLDLYQSYFEDKEYQKR